MSGERRVLCVVVGVAMSLVPAGCGGSAPTAATGLPQAAPSVVPPAPVHVVAFTDDATAFSTSDVLDVDDQVIHFDTGGDLIWTADGARFQGFRANGLQIKGPGPDDYFQVRFGTERGERRAYLGWSDDICHCPGSEPTLVDVDVVDGRIVFRTTDARVPGS